MQSTPSKLTEDDTSTAVQKTLVDGLLREARLFSHLKHRNIIQLFGVSPCLPTRNLYLVMEYAHGGALSYLLQQRRSGLYPTVFIQYAKQIAEGINYLHEEACEHIIHRDLKCSNGRGDAASENVYGTLVSLLSSDTGSDSRRARRCRSLAENVENHRFRTGEETAANVEHVRSWNVRLDESRMYSQ